MKLKFLPDESVQYATIVELRKNNFDILSIAESHQGVTDSEVLSIASDEQRIIVTEDKDFGELTFRLRKSSPGILLIRLADLPAFERPAKVLDSLVKAENEIEGRFVVITSSKIRIRKVMI